MKRLFTLLLFAAALSWSGCTKDNDGNAAGLSRDELEAAARQAPEVLRHTEGLTIAKVIVVPGKLVNIVAK